MSVPATVVSAWKQQAIWSAAASKLKLQVQNARVRILALIVVSAVLETAAAQLANLPGHAMTASRIGAASGAVLIAIATLLQARVRTEERLTKWIRARAASEALKEQVFRYSTRSGIYDVPDPESILRDATSSIIEKVRDIEAVAVTIEPTLREPPCPLDLSGYVKERVEKQIENYYRPRALELARQRDTWRRTQTILLFAGAGLGALVTLVPGSGIGAWVAVFTTVAGALGAHIEALLFDHLVISYRATATRLEFLRDEWHDKLSRKQLTPAERSGFVDRCEDAISVENQAWMANWTKAT